MIIYPKALKSGDTIGITAPSSGVDEAYHSRLNLVIEQLKQRDFNVLEGSCLRKNGPDRVSGSKEDRAKDFMMLWEDPNVNAIIPPWGGERAIELLPLLQYQTLKKNPKWLMGYSDISLLLFVITLKLDIATIHGTNLMDNLTQQEDPLTRKSLKVLSLKKGDRFMQRSSTLYQSKWPNYSDNPKAIYKLSDLTRWRILGTEREVHFSGRLLGGCLDVLMNLVGTGYGSVPDFIFKYKQDGIVLYFENVHLSPVSFGRALLNFRFADWFAEGVKGVVFGRSARIEEKEVWNFKEALESVFENLNIPVLYEADIGHMPPQMTLINGSMANFHYSKGEARLTQVLN